MHWGSGFGIYMDGGESNEFFQAPVRPGITLCDEVRPRAAAQWPAAFEAKAAIARFELPMRVILPHLHYKLGCDLCRH